MTIVFDFTYLRMSDYIIIWVYGDNVMQIIKGYNDEGFQNIFLDLVCFSIKFQGRWWTRRHTLLRFVAADSDVALAYVL